MVQSYQALQAPVSVHHQSAVVVPAVAERMVAHLVRRQEAACELLIPDLPEAVLVAPDYPGKAEPRPPALPSGLASPLEILSIESWTWSLLAS